MIRPYYQDDAVTLYHGDCRDILPHVSADAVVTDPPYGLGVLTGTEAKRRAKNAYSSDFDDSEDYIATAVLPALVMALGRCNGRGVVTPGVRCLSMYPRARDIGGFYQPAAAGMGPWGFASFNPVLFYGKDPFAGKHISATMVTLTEGPSDNRHPCAKPISACRWMVGKASRPGETVLDPFMGVGSVLVAAKHMGRKAIGIELSERYCEVAAERMSQSVLPLEMGVPVDAVGLSMDLPIASTRGSESS